MKRPASFRLLVGALCALIPAALLLGDGARATPSPQWPGFRGVNAAGQARGEGKLPAEIGPGKHVVWKTALPPGHSSPVIAGERIFLTTDSDGTLATVALDRSDGDLLWKRPAPVEELEPIHQIGSHAQSSCATDGSIVVSFFGSCGLLAYDVEGKELWSRPMGPFKNGFGAASSPLIVDDSVLLNQDHDTDSFLLRLEKKTGKPVWKADRSEFPRGFSTPAIWETASGRQVVVPGTLRIVGYDFATGEEVWTVRGVSRIVNTTPVVGADGNLYFACWSPGADAGERIEAEPFAELIASQDTNGNGKLELAEVPDGALKNRFSQIDRDKDDTVTSAEYDYMKNIFEAAQNVILAIRPGGEGDITASHVVWKSHRYLPYVPSPLYHEGTLFTVKNGGITASFSARTGELHKLGRVSGDGNYYSSPVVGDGKIYLLSERGDLSVISAQPEWDELHQDEFGEDCYATPAIVDGRIYLRTAGHLWCFGYE